MTWPLESCPADDREVIMLRPLLDADLIEHVIDTDGECWGASQIGRCAFTSTVKNGRPR